LGKLELFSLERRRLRGDQIEVYKIMKGIDRMNSWKLFPRSEMTNRRGHKFKVRGARFNTDMRGMYFTQGGGGLECAARQGG